MKKIKLNFVFLALLLLASIVFIIQAAIWGASEPYVFAFPLFRDVREIPFADYWHVNFIIHDNSPYYGDMSSYPPLVLVFAHIFASFADYTDGYETIYLTGGTGAVVSLYLFYLVFAFLYAMLLFRILEKKGFSLPVQIITVIVSFFSMGLVYNFERGNYVLYALLPALFFFGYYDSNKAWLRELSYIMLGISAGIKLYPALFALILLSKRQFMPFFRCVAYSLLALFVPFFFLDRGLANIHQFVRWLISFAEWQAEYGYNYSITNYLAIISSFFGGPSLEEADVSVYNNVALLVVAVSLLGGLFANKNYKVFIGASIAMILYPNPSFYYSAAFLVIPIVSFLEEKEKDKWDVAYMILFVLIVSPVYMGTIDAEYSLYVNQIVESTAFLIMLFLLMADTIYHRWSNIKEICSKILSFGKQVVNFAKSSSES